jgi:hypothetical protein
MIDININRINMAFLPLGLFSGFGPVCSGALIGQHSAYNVIAAVLSLLCTLFSLHLLFGCAENAVGLFFEGLGVAIKYAETLDKNTVWVTRMSTRP